MVEMGLQRPSREQRPWGRAELGGCCQGGGDGAPAPPASPREAAACTGKAVYSPDQSKTDRKLVMLEACNMGR